MRHARYALAIVTILILGLVATACGGDKSATATLAPAATTPTSGAATATTASASPPAASSPTSAEASPSASAAGSPVTGSLSLTDATGTTITLQQPATKIVCLVAECEDILFSLGMQPVAVNDTYGQDAHLWGDQAKSFTKIGGSFKEPSIEDIAKATPDLIIGIANADEQLRDALQPIAPLYITNPASYEDAIKDLEAIGQLTGHTGEATAAAKKLTDQLAEYKAKSPNTVSTVLIYGAAPNFNVFTQGSLTPSVLSEVTPYPIPAPAAVAGGSDNEPGAIPGSLEQLLTINPDTLLIASFGNSKISEQLKADPVWSQLKAVKNNQVYEVNANYYVFGRGTIALGLALQDAMSKLYPDTFGTPTP